MSATALPYSLDRAARAQRLMAYVSADAAAAVALPSRALGLQNHTDRVVLSAAPTPADAQLPRWFTPVFVAVSLMDLLLTWVILNVHFGTEANPVAKLILDTAGFPGLTLYKLALVALVLATTTQLLSHSPAAAKRLALAAVTLSAAPVVWSLHLLLVIWVQVWMYA
ncbi:MAG: DUF5658 family protein [Planctomycetota bacterium]